MSNFTNTFRDNFTKVPNSIVNDTNVSDKALGLFTYMASKPDNWTFSINGIVSQRKSSRTQVLSTLKELIQLGYLVKTKRRNGNFQATNHYELLETPLNPTESQNETHKMRLTNCDSQKKTTSKTNTNNTLSSNTITSPRGEDKKSSNKSKTQLDLPNDVNDYRKKLISSGYIGILYPIYVEQKLEDVYLDKNGYLYTDTKPSHQIVASTLNEMWIAIYEFQAAHERAKAYKDSHAV